MGEQLHPCIVTIKLDVPTFQMLTKLANSTLRPSQLAGPQAAWDYLPRYIREVCEVWVADRRCEVNHTPEKKK